MKKFYSVLSFALAVLFLLSPLTQAVSAEEISNSESNSDSFDFSSQNEYMLQAVISPADLLTLLLNDTSAVSEAERDYLDRYFADYLVYDELLPPSLVATEQSADRVLVRAQKYSYVATNGKEVVYLPVRVLLGDKESTLSFDASEQAFLAEFTDLPQGAEHSVTVFYQGSLTLPKEKINQLLTMAYRDAQEAAPANATITQYTVALKEYTNYLHAMEQYETDLLNYETYCSALTLYQNALERYNQNQNEWANYQQKNEKYQTYEKDLALYLQQKEQYDLDYAEYLRRNEEHTIYTSNLNKIRTSLHAIESLFLKPTDGKTGTLYRALQNAELVVMFEKYRDVLFDGETVSAMRADADRLNDLLGKYNEARNLSEEAAFTYYKQNYTEICTLFNSLYQRMNEVLTPNIYRLLSSYLEVEYPEDGGSYKKWRIKNVLAHIYLICLCLDDTKKPTASWSFYNDRGDPHTYYFSALLNQALIISDSNAANPEHLSWLPEVQTTEQPIAPVQPTEVQKPLAPAVLLEQPTAPDEVAQPQKPPVVEPPAPPTESDHALVERTREICLALFHGELSERELVTEDTTVLLPELSLEKRVGGPSIYGARGQLLPENDLSHRPTASADSARLPLSFENDYAVYTFENDWFESSDGEGYLYAQYRRTPKTFTATFVVGDQRTPVQVPVGGIPVFDGSTQKESDNTTDYIFTTWNPPLAPIYTDTEYVAQYREQTRTYAVTFSFREQSLTKHYEWNQIISAPITPTSYYTEATLYEFSGWDKEIVPVTQDTVYTACYRATVLAALPEGEEGSLSIATSATGTVLVSSGRSIIIEELIAKTAAEEKRLEILFSEYGISVMLNAAAARELYEQGMHRLVLKQDAAYGTAILCLDQNGTVLSLYDGELRVTMEHGFATEDNVYLSAYYPSVNSYQWSVTCAATEQTVQWIASSGVYYNPYRRFALTLTVGEHGQVFTNAKIYSAGEEILLTVHPNANYRIASITLTNPVSGEVITPDPQALTMPAWDAVLAVEFAPIEYRIEFIYHNQSTVQMLPFGATVVFPEIPTSFEEDGLFYTFIGWSSTALIVTGDATYTANYYTLRAEEVADSGEGGALNSLILEVLLPWAILALLILGAIIATPIVIVKRRKKHKKTPPPQD